MFGTNFDPHRYARSKAGTLKLETDIAIQNDRWLATAADEAGADDDDVRKALFLLIVTTLTSRGWHIDKLCEDARAAAVSDQRPTAAEIDEEVAKEAAAEAAPKKGEVQ